MQLQRFLTPRFKLMVHIADLGMVISAMIFCVVRIAIRDNTRPMTRTDTMALAMGAKSLIIIAYQLLSERSRRFKKWESKKANLILNCLEVLFWAAVAFMAIQSNTTQSCTGATCLVNWAIVVLAIQVSMISALLSYLSYREYKEFRESSRKNQYQMGSPSDTPSVV
ncbi:hypothetical protein F5X96DRAFT_692843 [Biscogniauxia mediterranea]|nr:hypothetical protein F5X96DRAFT_692843 [Biscogniauxia mediterranea]